MSISVLVILNQVKQEQLPKCPSFVKLTFADLASFSSPNVKPFELLSCLWQKNHITTMFTIGGPEFEFIKVLGNLPSVVTRVWFHLDDPSEFNTQTATRVMLNGPENKFADKPLISVLMTTFKSGDKLDRPWQSLLSQTYMNWELVVWDDSPNDDHDTFKQVQALALKDLRVKAYRGSHNGFIGDMKRRSASLAEGGWIVELDHDDRI